jgi:hypothetical protein
VFRVTVAGRRLSAERALDVEPSGSRSSTGAVAVESQPESQPASLSASETEQK